MTNSHTPVEVIDLTDSDSVKEDREIIVIPDSDNEPNSKHPDEGKEPQKESGSKRRKRKRKIPATTDDTMLKDVEKVKRKREELEEGEVPGDVNGSRRKRSRSPLVNSDALFFVDVGPATLPSKPIALADTHIPALPSTGLLLPSHVSVFGDAPVEILPTSPLNSEDESFIEFLDTDDRKDMARYFDEPEDEDAIATSKRRIICRKCHEEGHMQAECKTQLCLTCGARNEHSTYSCPVNKVCFNCGMKGHLSNQCQQSRGYAQRNFAGCFLCDDDSHQSNECPSLWRIYNYVTKERHIDILSIRKSKSELKLGEGGEGYIATDEWCYNCGECGHWGDDCDVQRPRDHPREHSAFGLYNVNKGPFSSEGKSMVDGRFAMKRGLRDWERESYLPEDWGAGAPGNVGKLGRRKEREKMAKRHQQDADEADEGGDFFARLSKQGPPLSIKGSAKKPSTSKPPKMKMSLSDRLFVPPPPQPNSLLSRIDMGGESERMDHSRARDRHGSSSRKTRHRDRSPRGREKERDGDRERDRERPRDKDRDRRRERDRDRDAGRRGNEYGDKRPQNNFGPQYRGGYSR